MLPILFQCTCLLALVNCVQSIVLDTRQRSSIVDAASLLAHGVQQLYNGNETGGVLGKWPYPPYYWWESGGAWGGMMNYWAFTGDESYSEVMMEALVSQLGPQNDFVQEKEMFDTGNDDQAFWAFVAMAAAEYGFPAPPSPLPAWHIIAQNVWADYFSRWNTTNCNGGLKWQFYPTNAGFTYKQSISNAAFFQLSARLARFTGNVTYSSWAERVWDWAEGIGLISQMYDVYDGSDEVSKNKRRDSKFLTNVCLYLINCTGIDHHQWTYNVGAFLYGAATLANFTNNTLIWVDRTAGLLAATDIFFTPYLNSSGIMFEAACELDSSCNPDQWSMKAYLARWMASAAVLAPYISDRVFQLLRASALGAATACTGGMYGNTCGSKWYISSFDNNTGLGQQLSALDVVNGLLAKDGPAPRTQPQVTIARIPPQSWPTTIPMGVGPVKTARPLHDQPAKPPK